MKLNNEQREALKQQRREYHKGNKWRNIRHLAEPLFILSVRLARKG